VNLLLQRLSVINSFIVRFGETDLLVHSDKGLDVEFSALGLNHEQAIASYITDFENAGEKTIHGYFGKPDWTHAETVEKLEAWSLGKDLGDWVPSTTSFLIIDGRIVGNYNFRHSLTPDLMFFGGNCGYSVRPSERRKGYATAMLQHAKSFGRTLGLTRMLVTCSVDNIGSARTIEKNNGVLQDVVYNPDVDEQIARYWIDL